MRYGFHIYNHDESWINNEVGSSLGFMVQIVNSYYKKSK